MNRTQIAFIRECLSRRKYTLYDKFVTSLPKPQAVVEAAQLVNDYDTADRNYRNAIRKAIEAQIHAIEEQLILGSDATALTEALNALDSWTPTS